MNRLCSRCTSRCIVSWCIWSYLCHCNSLCASTPRNQLTHQRPRGKLNIGVRRQNVGSRRALITGSRCTQVFGRQEFVYFDMKTGLWQICQSTVPVTKGAKVYLFVWELIQREFYPSKQVTLPQKKLSTHYQVWSCLKIMALTGRLSTCALWYQASSNIP